MSTHTDAMRRLAAADPAAHAEPGTDAVDHLRERVAGQPSESRRRGERRPLRLALAAAGVAIAIAGVSTVLPRASDPTPSAEAARVLNAAADRAAVGPSFVPRSGEYYYRRAVGMDARGAETGWADLPRRVVHELWIAPDGSGRVVRRTVPSAGNAGAIDDTLPPGWFTVPFGIRALTMREAQALPTDPGQLARAISDAAVRNSHPLAHQELDLVAEVLRTTPLAPALGAAFFRALAELPGIESLGERTDSLGRRGQAVGATDAAGLRLELIIDPSSGTLLADREVAVRRADEGNGTVPARPGDVVHEYTYVTRGVVDSVTDRPGRIGG